MLRLGEHLSVQVHLIRGGSRPGVPTLGDNSDAAGVLLIRRDRFATGAPNTLMLWSTIDLNNSPLGRLGGALRLGQAWVSQRELWWSGHPTVVWQRQDRSTVPAGAASSWRRAGQQRYPNHRRTLSASRDGRSQFQQKM